MHKVLRELKLNNEPLPENVKELQQLYLMNSAARDNKKFKYHQYKNVPLSLASIPKPRKSDILRNHTITNTSYDHSPKLPYFFFNYSIFSLISDCFLVVLLARLFSLLLVLRRVSLRGTPSILNSLAKFRSRKRS
jgi:hypothetical protein